MNPLRSQAKCPGLLRFLTTPTEIFITCKRKNVVILKPSAEDRREDLSVSTQQGVGTHGAGSQGPRRGPLLGIQLATAATSFFLDSFQR